MDDLNKERADYWQTVQSTVDDLVAEITAGNVDKDDAHDWLHEQIDGNYWVIYTYRAKCVVAFFSDNGDAQFDEGIEIDHSQGIDWSALAYFAMLADCRDRMPDLDDIETDEPEDEAA
jgi:hypothetical protein